MKYLQVPFEDLTGDSQSGGLTMSYTPVVEIDFGQERFLVENPIDTFKNGRFNKVPVIMGIVSGEYINMGLC